MSRLKDEIKRIHIKVYEYGEVNNRPLIERVQKSIVSGERVCFKIENNSKFGRNYYTRLRFMISVVTQREQEFDYIDGGFTNWTARLLNNQKERLLTSGIGTDFLLRTVKLQKV